jgi:hypothetical protein
MAKPLQTGAVDERLLHHPPFADHRPNLLVSGEGNQRPASDQAKFFNAIRRFEASPAFGLCSG